MGGELAGMIGNEVQIQSRKRHRIGRIAGLDPARPGFFLPTEYRHIESTDAGFVDIYHCNPTNQGAPFPVGRVDFWINNPDQIQPGCETVGKYDGFVRFTFSTTTYSNFIVFLQMVQVLTQLRRKWVSGNRFF